jgi:hypothetical protein
VLATCRSGTTRRIIDELCACIHRRGHQPETYAADEIAGYDPAKTGVTGAYVTHRHPAFWRDPERFDPDRFLPENSATARASPTSASGGPRLCIGRSRSPTQISSLANASSRGRPGHTVQHEIRITLRPQHDAHGGEMRPRSRRPISTSGGRHQLAGFPRSSSSPPRLIDSIP